MTMPKSSRIAGSAGRSDRDGIFMGGAWPWEQTQSDRRQRQAVVR
jgi:hypothetical protein